MPRWRKGLTGCANKSFPFAFSALGGNAETLEERMKALENLGKISNVGLFSEKLEINVTHRSVDDLEKELAKTLEMYMGDAVEVKPTELDTVKSIGDIDLDEELGDTEPKDESGTTPES
jgi:threonine dehydrogenase-like Zn-dependent dehydrogenase